MQTMHTTLSQIAGDRQADPEDRQLAADMLALMRKLRLLHKEGGYGELLATMTGDTVSLVKAVLTEKVEG